MCQIVQYSGKCQHTLVQHVRPHRTTSPPEDLQSVKCSTPWVNLSYTRMNINIWNNVSRFLAFHRGTVASRMPEPVHAIAKPGAEPSDALSGWAGLGQHKGIYKSQKHHVLVPSCPSPFTSFPHKLRVSCVLRRRFDLMCFCNLLLSPAADFYRELHVCTAELDKVSNDQALVFSGVFLCLISWSL